MRDRSDDQMLWSLLAAVGASAIATAAGALHAPAILRFTISFIPISGLLYVAVVSNREERRRLMHDALTDPVTGAFNRRHFHTGLRVFSERLGRNSEPASLIVLDVDHFKAVNDTFGHSAGDVVLKVIVTVVLRRIRVGDAVYRTGGDEFAVLLSNATAAEAMAVAEGLRFAVERVLVLGRCRVSMSGGVCALQAGQSIASWLADADAALYQAKRNGRNQIASADPMVANNDIYVRGTPLRLA